MKINNTCVETLDIDYQYATMLRVKDKCIL